MNTEPLSVGRKEAAQMLGIGLTTLDKLIALKELSARRLGRRVLIPRIALENLLRKDHATQKT